MKRFKTILIANRGEIACRIIRTAKKMGLQTVAIYSTVDANSQHVRLADRAYWVGEAPSKDSYLNIAAIIEVAKKAEADAIHPGYGFLSENAVFVKACLAAHIVFIGPTAEAMKVMGSKQLSKQLLEKSKVPLTPGYHGNLQTNEVLTIEAERIGYPILLKAAAGGGGKGMRVVNQAAELNDALAGARREALASFADDTLIIEKLVVNARHIEVQIMADNHGNVVHLFERDCSIQRRHQKIIEEAPALSLTDTQRQQVTAAAIEVARAIEYRGAGTVEFLMDAAGSFYFMEMNTRLQVEHPVTELITGLDLVEWQIKIAENEPLPLKQAEITKQGHAIECRIYAEDPLNHFLPSIGQISFLKEPQGLGIRVDTGVQAQDAISQYYDPMIAKLIAYGSNRAEALCRLQQALAQYYVGGIHSNLGFLQAICHNERFQQAAFSTQFLTEESIQPLLPNHDTALCMAIAYDYWQAQPKDVLYQDTFAWQMHLSSEWTKRYIFADTEYDVSIIPMGKEALKVSYQGITKHLKIALNDGFKVAIDEQPSTAFIAPIDSHWAVYQASGYVEVYPFDYAINPNADHAHHGQLTAPMPSTIVAILKKVGDSVKKGEPLVVLEAMKMEHSIYANCDGILSALFYPLGAQVSEGAELLSLEAVDG